MVGLGNRLLESGPINDINLLKVKYDQLLKNEDFLSAVERATTDEKNVRTRLKLAKEAISEVP